MPKATKKKPRKTPGAEPKHYRLSIADERGRYRTSYFWATEEDALARARRLLKEGDVYVRVDTDVDDHRGTSTLVAELRGNLPGTSRHHATKKAATTLQPGTRVRLTGGDNDEAIGLEGTVVEAPARTWDRSAAWRRGGAWVEWDGLADPSWEKREWLTLVDPSTRHHATKKSPTQLQREIDEALRKSALPGITDTFRRTDIGPTTTTPRAPRRARVMFAVVSEGRDLGAYATRARAQSEADKLPDAYVVETLRAPVQARR